jgi:hypothetical protein
MEIVMNRLRKAYFAVALGFTVAATGIEGSSQTLEDIQRTQPGIVADGVLAYIYGYPLMMFGVTGRTGTTVPNDMTKLGAAPLNQFGKETRLPDASFTAVVLPSTSTLYASAFLNLCVEPVILHIPNMGTRFFIMQMLSGWTEVSPDSPGSNKNDAAGGDYALVGPPCQDWPTPTIPATVVKTIHIPTSSMWIIGRVYTDGSTTDIDRVTQVLFPQLTLTPLSKYVAGQPVVSENVPVQPYADTVTPPLKQVAAMDACAFFQNMAAMMNFNLPIPVQDDPILGPLLRLGLVAKDSKTGAIVGTNFDCTSLRPEKIASLQRAVTLAQNLLQSVDVTRSTPTNWTVSLDVGVYGRRYFLRAEVAQDALGANRKEDAVYGYTKLDGGGANLNGRRKYKIHFAPPGEKYGIPPVYPGGFWSVTIYDLNGKLIPPPDTTNANWNAVGMPPVNGHPACPNKSDNSLDLYLQSEEPPLNSQQFCNWLPTPSSGGYIVFLRMYWPGPTILSGDWVPPGIEKN